MKSLEYLNETGIKCLKCDEEAIIKVRSDVYCKQCYLRFIRGKQRKQMSSDKYKVKYLRDGASHSTEKVLLAFSGGVSSLVLLDVLARLLEEQKNTHRDLQGFELVVANISESDGSTLESLLSSSSIMQTLLELVGNYEVSIKVKVVTPYIDPVFLRRIGVDYEFNTFANNLSIEEQSVSSLAEILRASPNRSSSEDLRDVIFHQELLRLAQSEGCGTIVYGHSMSRLAIEVLALTVKGRGSNVHSTILDRVEDYCGDQISIIYPFRDLFEYELREYAVLSDLMQYESAFAKYAVPKSKVSKNMTVREILSMYLDRWDESGYLSTASTVVKIGEKLTVPTSQNNSSTYCCDICAKKIYQDPKDWLQMITVNEPAPLVSGEERDYLHQYLTSHTDTISKSGEHVNLCYGCITAINGAGGDSGVIWPLQKDVKFDHGEKEKAKVLKEYSLE